MFQTYQYVSPNGGGDEDMHYEYYIIDSDFEEIIDYPDSGYEEDLAGRIIEVYRRRNLPVVPNLILFWQCFGKMWSRPMEKLVEWSEKHNPYHSEYEDEINKYLLLL